MTKHSSTVEHDAPADQAPTISHRGKRRFILIVSTAAAVIIAVAVVLFFALRPMSLKDHSYTLHDDWQLSLKMPARFTRFDDSGSDSSYGLFVDPSDRSTSIQYGVDWGSGRIDDFKRELEEVEEATRKSSTSDIGDQQRCDGIFAEREGYTKMSDDQRAKAIEKHKMREKDPVVWSVSTGKKEFSYRGVPAVSGNITCKAIKDIPAFGVKKGETYVMLGFVTDKQLESGSTLSMQIYITAPANHPVQKVRQQIFNSVTLTPPDAR